MQRVFMYACLDNRKDAMGNGYHMHKHPSCLKNKILDTSGGRMISLEPLVELHLHLSIDINLDMWAWNRKIWKRLVFENAAFRNGNLTKFACIFFIGTERLIRKITGWYLKRLTILESELLKNINYWSSRYRTSYTRWHDSIKSTGRFLAVYI